MNEKNILIIITVALGVIAPPVIRFGANLYWNHPPLEAIHTVLDPYRVFDTPPGITKATLAMKKTTDPYHYSSNATLAKLAMVLPLVILLTVFQGIAFFILAAMLGTRAKNYELSHLRANCCSGLIGILLYMTPLYVWLDRPIKPSLHYTGGASFDGILIIFAPFAMYGGVLISDVLKRKRAS